MMRDHATFFRFLYLFISKLKNFSILTSLPHELHSCLVLSILQSCSRTIVNTSDAGRVVIVYTPQTDRDNATLNEDETPSSSTASCVVSLSCSVLLVSILQANLVKKSDPL